MSEVIKNRYDFVILYDVTNGNPNGDPDAGGMPRIDPETGHGIVTDVCLKRKIRNYVQIVKEDAEGFEIYVKASVPLNRSDVRAGEALKCTEELQELNASSRDSQGRIVEKIREKLDKDSYLRDEMCRIFYDIRTFGAVMTTFMKGGLNCGQVRGPVQLGFSRSIDPVVPCEVTITRQAITTESSALDKSTEMGNKFIIPYGLYRCEGYVSANLARKSTGFTEEDLELLWDAIVNMFEHDHSASRGNMVVRRLIIFKHENELGMAPSHRLFDLVKVNRVSDSPMPTRNFSDYEVVIEESQIPKGVEIIQLS